MTKENKDQTISEIKLTNELALDPLIESLSPLEKKRYEKIEQEVYNGNPTYIKNIIAFIKDHPSIKRPYNFLSVLYGINGEDDNCEKIIKEMYKKFPDYLFAKIGYAKLCLQDGDMEEFDRIFDGKRNLTLVYPERSEFHTSEFLAFTDLLCEHAFHIEDFDFVRNIIKEIKKMDLDCDEFIEDIEEELTMLDDFESEFLSQ